MCFVRKCGVEASQEPEEAGESWTLREGMNLVNSRGQEEISLCSCSFSNPYRGVIYIH